jgi:FixJ family two-component response regulator
MSRTVPVVAIVDDEDSVRRALERLLRSAGMDAHVFASGETFLESLSSGRPDCVVLDLHMPGVTGFDVQARLNDAGLGVPVIVITGHDSAESRERVHALGASAYLRKPVGAKLLLEAIQRATTRRNGSPTQGAAKLN